MEENTVSVILKRKLKVRIPLEVEHCNNPIEEQHIKDTSSGGKEKGKSRFSTVAPKAAKGLRCTISATVNLRIEGEHFSCSVILDSYSDILLAHQEFP